MAPWLSSAHAWYRLSGRELAPLASPGGFVCAVTSVGAAQAREQGSLVVFSAVAMPPADSVRVPPMGLRQQPEEALCSQPASPSRQSPQGLKTTGIPNSCTLHMQMCTRGHAHADTHMHM